MTSRLSHASSCCLILAAFAALIIAFGAAGCGTVKNYTDPSGPMISGVSRGTPSYQGKELVVVSYNIELGMMITRAIEDIESDSVLRSADIFLLQEMDPRGVGQIAEHLDFNYIYYPSGVHAKHGEDYGNAILSRWPLKDHTKIVLPHSDPLRDQIRIGTAATVVVGEREIRVISAHTEMYRLMTSARLNQVDSLVHAIDTSFDYVVIGGDFNTVRESVLRRFDGVFERAGFLRASEGIGRTSRSDPIGVVPLELDHIYTRGFLVTDQGKVMTAEASDHYPIWVTLRFSKTL